MLLSEIKSRLGLDSNQKIQLEISKDAKWRQRYLFGHEAGLDMDLNIFIAEDAYQTLAKDRQTSLSFSKKLKKTEKGTTFSSVQLFIAEEKEYDGYL